MHMCALWNDKQCLFWDFPLHTKISFYFLSVRNGFLCKAPNKNPFQYCTTSNFKIAAVMKCNGLRTTSSLKMFMHDTDAYVAEIDR
jgi:hypothetical protein